MRDGTELRFAQIERHLTRLGSQVTGNQRFQADRISDLIEQIDELRQEVARLSEELERVAERQDKIASFLKQQIKPKEEES